MPSTGTPSWNTDCGAVGPFTSVTDSGPPDRMMPLAPKSRTSASVMSHGRISQYTPLSRTRRAISWVYCAPKSRIRMRCAWMSERGKVSADTVVGRFFRDRDVVNVAFAHTGVGDANELGARAHFLNGLAAGVTHG